MKQETKNIILGIGAFALIIFIAIYFKRPDNEVIPTTDTDAPSTTVITISEKPIKEENYTGSKAVVSGSIPIANLTRMYIDQSVTLFADMANTDVPDMRKTYGADSATAQYTIEIKAKYIEGSTTESIVISQYIYTGGAHGTSIYQVFNGSRASGETLTLDDIITDTEQGAFVSFIKQRLLKWKPEGIEQTVVFVDAVSELTFDSLGNWSLDNKNFTIYFDQYAIGPGALGAVAFPIPISEMKPFLKAF